MPSWRPVMPAIAAYLLVAFAGVAVFSAYEPVAVRGGSMAPALHHGDLVIVRRGARPKAGDIVLIRQPGHSAVLHRAVRLGTDGLVTRGDANPIPDFEQVDSGDTAGVVRVYVPFGALIERWRARVGSDTLSAQSDTARR